MAALHRRSRPSSYASVGANDAPLLAIPPSQVDVDEWIDRWKGVPARGAFFFRLPVALSDHRPLKVSLTPES